jgi:prepilin-type N-terminal cleavage/methylation domain-containing protein
MCKNTTAQSVGRTVGSRAGFTLIELLIVIVILAISAAIAVPMMSSAASSQMRAAGGIVAADLEYARSMAISRGQKHKVVFDPANERYEIQDQSGAVIKHPVTQKENGYIVNFTTDGRLDQVKVDSATFGASNNNFVEFDSLGSPDNGGTVVLKAGDFTRTVTVEPVTGFISVSE